MADNLKNKSKIESPSFEPYTENIGSKKFPIYYSRFGFSTGQRIIIAGGIHWSKKISVLKARSELSDRLNIYNIRYDSSYKVKMRSFFNNSIKLFDHVSISPLIKNGVDASGFASHTNKIKALNNSILELIERKFTSECESKFFEISEVTDFSNELSNHVKNYLNSNQLSINIFFIRKKNIPDFFVYVSQISTTKNQSCFGAAANLESVTALNHATLEAMMLYHNVSNLWKNNNNNIKNNSAKKVIKIFNDAKYFNYFLSRKVTDQKFKKNIFKLNNLLLKKVFKSQLYYYTFAKKNNLFSYKFHTQLKKISSSPFT